ncbi:hypothetical protein [uncultured Microbacterium sp.]|uniref:hypothetical protein n=1 Tax=uncultured Microbacterium sp. TaxID=191216 RepID=UPI0028D0DFB2|nr:hypothetical protein [uncultured Microbacterium sp.]
MSASPTPRRLRAWGEGALLLASFIPWSVLCCVWAVVMFASLWGYSSKGEEWATVVIGLALAGTGVAFSVLAALALARRTRMPRGGAWVLVALVTLAWTVGVFALWGSSVYRHLPDLPWPFSLMVLTGFTVPVAVLGILGLIAVAALRRMQYAAGVGPGG